MDIHDILAALGEPDGVLGDRQAYPSPPSDAAEGAAVHVVAIAALSSLFVWKQEHLGVTCRVFADAPGCVQVEGPPPIRTTGATADRRGSLVLDGQLGAAAALFEVDGERVVVVTHDGLVQIGTLADPVAARLSAWTPPATAFVSAPLSIDDALVGVSTPAWLEAQARALAAGEDETDAVAAIGLLARHAPRDAVARARAWARALPVEDVACLDRWILAECGLWEDALRDLVDHPDVAGARRLVLRRDHLASLAAARSLAGVGSVVHGRLAALDDLARESLSALPADVGLRGDPALRAAGTFDPEAWWAELGG